MQKQRRLASAAFLFAACGLFAGAAGAAEAQGSPQAQSQYDKAINSPARTDDDRKSDAKRKPAQFLEFAQVRPGMKVLDLMAGGGTTSVLLAAAVAPGGEVWAQNNGTTPSPKIEARIATGKVPNLHALAAPIDSPIIKDKGPYDLVVINMSYHDVVNSPADRDAMNKHIYEALKKGGHFVVIDNSAKPGSGLSATKTLHRIDEATVIEEVTKAGFKVQAKGDYLRAPSDPREQPFWEMKDQPDDKFAIRFVK